MTSRFYLIRTNAKPAPACLAGSMRAHMTTKTAKKWKSLPRRGVAGSPHESGLRVDQNFWPNRTPKNCGLTAKVRDEPEQKVIEQKVFIVSCPRRSNAF